MYSALIYQLNAGGGFFSTFFFLCKAFLTAKKARIPFFIEDISWPYTYEKGWHDYFRTLETPPQVLKLPIANARRVTHITQSTEEEFSLQDYRAVTFEIFKLHPHLIERAQKIIESMAGNYVAIFVRRGDKLIEEAPYISASDILAKIPHDSNTIFFIQTDDYTVIEEFQEIHPKDRIRFTTPSYKRGQYLYPEHKERDGGRNKYIDTIIPVVRQPKHRIKDETEEMLVGLTVCYSAPSCWTDHFTNVGRFLKLMNPERVHFYPEDLKVDLNMIGCPAGFFPRTE